MDHATTQAFEDAEFEINAAGQAMKGLAVSIGAEMLPQFKALAEGTRDVAKWFADLTPEQRQNAAIALEVAAGAAAISLAAQGVIAVAGPWISAIDRASQAYLALSTSARAAALSVAAIGIGAAVVAGAAVYKGVKDYEHAQNGGSFEYDDLGNVTQKEGSAYTSYDSDDYDKVSSDFDPSKMLQDAVLAQTDTTPGTLDFMGSGGRGGGGGSSKSARDTSVQDAREYLALFDDATRKVEDFQSTWDSIKGDTDNSLFGNVDEQVDKVRQAYEDAQAARLKAEADGNSKAAELLAKTEADRLDLLKQTEAEAASIKESTFFKIKMLLKSIMMKLEKMKKNIKL